MSLARRSFCPLILMNLGQCHDPGVWAKIAVLRWIMQFKRLQGPRKGQKYYERSEDGTKIQMGLANLPHRSYPRFLCFRAGAARVRPTCGRGWVWFGYGSFRRRAHQLPQVVLTLMCFKWPNTWIYFSTVITTKGPGW